jgi:hypothetical protein
MRSFSDFRDVVPARDGIYPQPDPNRSSMRLDRLYTVRGMANVAAPIEAGRIQLIGRLSTAPENTTIIPDAIIANKRLGPGPKLVYSMLLSYAAANEPATNNRLAADLAVSPRSIRNYISALKAAGLIMVWHHPGKPRSFNLVAAL